MPAWLTPDTLKALTDVLITIAILALLVSGRLGGEGVQALAVLMAISRGNSVTAAVRRNGQD